MIFIALIAHIFPFRCETIWHRVLILSIPYTILLQLGTGFDIEAIGTLVTARLQHFTKRRKEKLLRLTIHLVEAGGDCDVVAFVVEKHDCPFHWTVDKMLLADAPICKGIH